MLKLFVGSLVKDRIGGGGLCVVIASSGKVDLMEMASELGIEDDQEDHKATQRIAWYLDLDEGRSININSGAKEDLIIDGATWLSDKRFFAPPGGGEVPGEISASKYQRIFSTQRWRFDNGSG